MSAERTPSILPTLRVGELDPRPANLDWLVRPLWGRASVGILGGPPKVAKTWLALELATSVASGRACLGRFPVEHPGPTLVYLAEDDLASVRARVESLCEHRAVSVSQLDLHVITVPALCLDRPEDRAALEATVGAIRPRLLVLDPLVRLHAGDENSSQDVSRLLGFLRQLQRQADLALLLVHHVRKRAAATPGEALRGSSDFFAWTDSALNLSRERDGSLLLTAEHRFSPAPPPMRLELVNRPDGSGTHLRLLDEDSGPSDPSSSKGLASRILEILEAAEEPLSNRQLREQIQIQNQRLSRALADLEQSGFIARSGREGWTPVTRAPSALEPFHQPALPFPLVQEPHGPTPCPPPSPPAAPCV